MIALIVFQSKVIVFQERFTGWLKRLVIWLLSYLLQSVLSHFRFVVWPNLLVYELLVLFPYCKQRRSILSRLHSLAEIRFDNTLGLARIFCLILITRLLHVLINRLSVFLLLLCMLVYHLLGGLNCHQGVTVHCVSFL